ncbi:hypothetical protein Cgig2_027874 [Carnegiea gigantea]|uniref:Uncharacterized protein n=1 Tax=Carnegiea gigantea TaxID=171969 RepID=A0A9Q1KLV1_9CARY|nr:hypothetical protein Cgig2_027874 [Carnegiea gigantea]
MTSTANYSLSSSLVSGADVQSFSSPDTPSLACSSANMTVSLPSAFPAPPLPPPSLGSGILVSGASSFPVPDLSAIYALGAPSSSWPSPISHTAVLSSQPSGPSVTSVGPPPSTTPPPPPVLQPPVDFSSWPSTGASLPPIHPTLFTVNVKNFITVVLTTVEDFLSWRTQFIAFLVTQQLSGFFDVQLTLNGLDEDYHTLVTTLSYGTNLLTFDGLCSKLIHYEQRLKFLKTKDLLSLQR